MIAETVVPPESVVPPETIQFRIAKCKDLSLRYSAMLLFISTVMLVEGMVRYIQSEPWTPYEDLTGMAYRLIIAGAWEVFVGCLGMITALSVIAFDSREPLLASFVLFFQLFFGAFYFIVYTIEQPLHNFAHDMSPPEYPENSFSRNQLNTANSFGYIVGSVTACTIVYGFQIYCTINLVDLQNEGGLQSNTTALPIYSFWNIFLIAWLGVSMLVLGSMISDQEGSGEIDEVYVFPPNIVKYAPETLASGSLLVIFACLLMLGTVGGDPDLIFSSFWGVVTWIWFVCGHVMSQITGTESVGFSGSAASLVCLMTGVIFVPLFVVGQISRDKRWAADGRAEALQQQAPGGPKLAAVPMTAGSFSAL
jgi:hypothetical protein